MKAWGFVMAMHNTNRLLKYGLPMVLALILLITFLPKHTPNEQTKVISFEQKKIPNNASNDSAAESLDTLTAELALTKKQISQISKDNTELKTQNQALLQQMQSKDTVTTNSLAQQIEQLKSTLQQNKTDNYAVNNANTASSISTVPDLTNPTNAKLPNAFNFLNNSPAISHNNEDKKNTPIPYYTIPANATSVKDHLMTALVGRIPVKGIVTDPYPFKIVFSDDTLAANGLRVPNLRQMIVSGYTEGDLNLLSVRGWVTSLTFVFNDGTISTTTSNNNDIGHFTKENALGYLSDKFGNPFIRGKLITNAPTYLSGNILLAGAQGAASAYAAEQTTNSTNVLGGNSSSVTGSPTKYVLGQTGVNAMSEAQQWWHDREENSFDAIYVATIDSANQPTVVAVNFTKEIQIDYNQQGRKIAYENLHDDHVSRRLD